MRVERARSFPRFRSLFVLAVLALAGGAAVPVAATPADATPADAAPAAADAAADPIPGAVTGAVTGVVTDLADRPLSGARIRIEGSPVTATTGVTGAFTLPGVAAGERTLVVSYLGYEEARQEVRVPGGGSARLEIELAPLTFGEEVTVTAEPILEGQARALNQQKNAVNIQNIVAADQIGRFPDPNAAEATQRIPGVTLQRDQGEGRYVLVRGTAARLNSTTINGERIPSPEGDVRNVALDVIPADLLAAIEVSKALTPDMDGDAIGGAVNLVTRRAPRDLRVAANAGYGYNDLSDDDIQTAGFTFGRRFAQGRTGLLVTASALETNRGSENFEVAYDDGFLEELELRDYTVQRERYGVNADLDHSLTGSSELYLRGIWNEFGDQEFRRRVVNVVPDGELERELKDRYEVQEILALSGGGNHLLGGSLLFDWRLSWAYAEEDEPGRLDSTFIQEDVLFAPNVTPGSIDPDDVQARPLNEDLTQYVLDDVVREDNLTTEDDLVLAANLTLPFYREGGTGGLWKLGAKVRDKSKDRDLDVVEFEGDDVFLVDFLGGFREDDFLDGRYGGLGPFQDAGSIEDLLARLESERDVEEDAADYDAEELTWAGYGMAEVAFSDRLTLLGGLRYEYTDLDYEGRELVLDDEGDFVRLEPTSGSSDYGLLLPMAHLKYALDADSNLRAAVTRSLARPNYEDLSPYNLILEEDGEIERGNPELDPTVAWNLDLMYERYFSTIGVFSVGLFHKQLDDVIFFFTDDQVVGGEEFEVTQPRNGEGADLTGFEVAYQNQFRRLPAPFDGLGLYLNYTWTDSSADLPGGREARLPGQAEHVGNLALSYEKAGFSGRVSLNYHGDYIEEVGGEAAEDEYVDEHLQLDLSVQQRLTPSLRLYLELINLTDEPLRVYQGTSDRPIQEEYYSWWGTIGLKWDF